MANDDTRLTLGEKNLAVLEVERPAEKASLTAWKGCVALTRAVHAHEAGRADEFAAQYRRGMELFAEAERLGPANGSVKAIMGGTYAALSDRLPEAERSAGWEAAYQNYKGLWAMQGPTAAQLPLHDRGELLAGVAQSAERTLRGVEAAEFARRIVETIPGTPYATAAKRWLDTPELRGRSHLGCQTCHEPGRLAAATARLRNQ